MPCTTVHESAGGFVNLPESGGGYVNVSTESGGGFVNVESGGGFINVAESGGGFVNLPESGALPAYFQDLCGATIDEDKADVVLAVQAQLNSGSYMAADWIGCVPANWLPGGAESNELYPDYDPDPTDWGSVNQEAKSWFGGLNKAAQGWYQAVTGPPAPAVPAVGAPMMMGKSPGGVPTWAIVGGIGAAVLLLAVAVKRR